MWGVTDSYRFVLSSGAATTPFTSAHHSTIQAFDEDEKISSKKADQTEGALFAANSLPSILATESIPSVDQPSWFYSPGFGGAAALVAAAIAAIVAICTIRAHQNIAREQRGLDKKIAEDKLEAESKVGTIERSWQRFEWLAGTTDLPTPIKAQLIDALATQVNTLGDRGLTAILVRYSTYAISTARTSRAMPSTENP